MLGRLKRKVRRGRSHGSSSDSERSNGLSSSSVSTGVRAPPSSAFSTRDYSEKVAELAAFDACVEACDALAASSAYAQSSVRLDKESGLKDCSVLVSPDGDLLLVPQDAQDLSSSQEKTSEDTKIDSEDDTTEKDEQKAQTTEAPSLSAVLSGDFGEGSPLYESAVLMGNDLRPDKTINGFSASGWSPPATSLAVRQTEQSLRQMVTFVEGLILSQKDAAARAGFACDQLRTNSGLFAAGNVPPMPAPASLKTNGRFRRSGASKSDIDDYDLVSALDAMPFDSSAPELNPSRVGPLFSSGTLRAATAALELYYATVAENDAERLRLASKSVNNKVGVLPALQQSAEKTTQRAYNREKALREMEKRAEMMERRLANCKLEAKQRWEAVHEAEEAVTKIVEDRMLERSRERERRRLEQMREDEEKRAENKTDLGATSAEIWDIVSSVSASMEDGSFAPTGLPDAPLAGPRDKTSGEETAPEPPTSPRSPEPPFPLASRHEIEQEVGLPKLRAAAMAADEAIEDRAGSLLNILSTLDTTKRSSRIAAETCLLSACHAQEKCIRSLIALERAAIEDRLENIKALEQIADNINVRSDLDSYITKDKKERGGSTRLGDDDDGGVASALAVLSSHVDGNMGLRGSSSKLSTEGWSEDVSEDISAEQLEDAIEALFEKNELLHDDAEKSDQVEKAREEYDKVVEFLCKTASDKSSSASRSRRSTICYAVNSKRSSNAELDCRTKFEGVCRLFRAILSGCDREAGGVSNAKMCMMLSQTFYMVDGDDEDASPSDNPMGSPTKVARSKRIFIKHKLMDHPLWADEEFWDQALYQCVSESLTHSGVMSNFDREASNANQSEWTETRKMKWHDLTLNERAEAASQVHAVVFAQLGALAHSMVEFGCGLDRSCAFVRRMAIRNQLPISQRTMLLKHLMGSDESQS